MEPTAILGAIGFALAQLSFVVLNLAELNKRRQKYMDCKNRLDEYGLTVTKLVSQYRIWQAVWRRPDISHYRAIWSDQYENIQLAKQRIYDLTLEIKQTVAQIYANNGAPNPRQNNDISLSQLTKKELKLLKRVAFALSTDTRLSETIMRLRTAVENLTSLCQDEFARSVGSTKPTTVTAPETEELVRLISFFTSFTNRAEAIYRERLTGQIAEETNAWALELGNLGKVTNIKEWDQWDPVEVRFAFHRYPPHPNGTRMSLCVSHQRDVNDNPGREAIPINFNWQQVVCGNGVPRADVRREEWSAVRQCRPFGRLFRDGFFEDDEALKSWEPHRAELILSLVNWVLLLWVGLSTLSADGSHRGDCNHHEDKLRNFGILMAELITATNIRRVVQPLNTIPIRYQKWSRAQDDWVPISQREIISLVHEKSNSSRDMRDVIKYCLDESNARTPVFEAGYLLEYIVRLYEPIEKWCKNELQESVDFGLETWPCAALEDGPAQPIQAWPVHAYLKGRAGNVGVGILAFVAVALVALFAAGTRDMRTRDMNSEPLTLYWVDNNISDD
ncbi:hypothetical protein F5Y19DRAFT_491307 [Xylariaceae sp. FL1651]|nr:hypothetical protein F5Y19DRAFT_491307 [Xylariaceae sp. FL1651]